MIARRMLIPAVIALLAAVPGATAKVGLSKVGSFKQPVYVSSAPGTPGLLVVEQPGRVVAVVKGKKRGAPFLDIRGLVQSGGEQGLLSIAFAPDYASSGLFYVYYTNNAGDNVVAEFRRASTFRADPASNRTVLEIPHPVESNHNGGQLQFGPDGLLYVGTGDGGGAGDTDNSAQSVDSLLGKILRIDPRATGSAPYISPATNPFANGPGRDEIFAIGLRNPFRFSIDDAATPHIVIGDVGQNRFEEVDYETLADANGANFGWNDFEAFSPFEGAIPPTPSRHDRPIFAYSIAGKRCAMIGGFIVSDPSLRSLRGRYVFGDFCDGLIRSFVPDLSGARKVRKVGAKVEQLSSFGETAGGKLFATSLAGPVYRLVRGKSRKR